MRLISEPTAAAIAYGATQLGGAAPRTILVFDMGAGTLDVSIVRVAGAKFQVLASAGNLHLGGEDFDDRLLNHFAGEFHAKTGKDIRNNPNALARLRAACERAKRTLSSRSETKMEIESLVDNINFSATVTRARFEDLCIDRFQAAILEVDRALEEATRKHRVTKKDIDHVLLSCGSAKIPMVQQLLSEYFDGKPLNKNLDSDETIARGAAIYAAALSGNASPAIRVVALSDVVLLSLGVAYGKGKEMRVIIPRNTPRPVVNKHVFRTHYSDDRKRDIVIEVYAGERPLAKDNHRLGEVALFGIKPLPEGTPQIDVTFSVDANNVLTVT
ncbi:heat shock protein 70, partial [Aphelenchoides avenae]